MTFNPVTTPVDYILLANKRSPGIAVVNAANSPRQWDVRRGYALSGSRVVFRGVGLAHPIVTLRLLSDEDWNEWHEWRTLLDRPTVGTRRGTGAETTQRARPVLRGAGALDIWHPILEDLGIAAVVVEDVLQPKQVADGEWAIDIKFVEFRSPTFALRPVTASDTTDAEPLDPIEQYIDNLTGQVQAYAPEE